MSQRKTIARPYAEAAFQHASQQGDLQAWSGFLAKLGTLSQNEHMLRAYHSPKVDRENLFSVMAELTGVAEQSPQANFIRLILEHKRFDVCVDIHALYVMMEHAAKNTTDVHIETAVAITDKEMQQFSQKFSELLGGKIELHCSTNPELLGGFTARYGDKVIDSSIKGQITRLAQNLMNESEVMA